MMKSNFMLISVYYLYNFKWVDEWVEKEILKPTKHFKSRTRLKRQVLRKKANPQEKLLILINGYFKPIYINIIIVYFIKNIYAKFNFRYFT